MKPSRTFLPALLWAFALGLVGLGTSVEAAAQSPEAPAQVAPTTAEDSAQAAPPSPARPAGKVRASGMQQPEATREEPGVPERPPAVASAEAAQSELIGRLLEDVETTARQVASIRKRLAVSTPAGKKLLLPELEDASIAYRLALTDAASALTGSAVDSVPDAAKHKARAEVSGKLRAEGKRLWQGLHGQYQEALSLIDKTDKSKKEGRAELEGQRNALLQRLPSLLTEYHQNLEAQELLKQDTHLAVAAFKKLLQNSAKAAGGTLKGIAKDIEQLKTSFGSTASAEQQAELSALGEYRELVADLQRKHVDIMDSYGLDTVQERQDLIVATGKVTQDILDTDVLGGLLKKWKTEAVAALTESAPGVAFRLATAVFIVLLFWGLARLAKRLMRRALDRPEAKTSSLAVDFFVNMTGRVTVLVGLVVATAQLGIEVGPLLTGLGIAGFIVGFALQDTLSNFASGMMILIYRPFDVGDVIEAGGLVGKVQAMTLVSTSVLTFDNQMLLVPNNKIWGDTIRNLTHQTTRRVDLIFGISYADDIEHAERVLNGILQDDERVLDEPAPVVRVHELGDSSVNFVVRPWVKTEDYWEVYWAVTRAVKRRFDAEGLSIPFPQRDVHLYEERLALRTVRDSDVAPKPSQKGLSTQAKGA